MAGWLLSDIDMWSSHTRLSLPINSVLFLFYNISIFGRLLKDIDMWSRQTGLSLPFTISKGRAIISHVAAGS